MYKIIFLILLMICTFSFGDATTKKQEFKNFISHKDFTINIDINSIKVVKGPEYPMISLDSQLVMTDPVKEPKTQKLIKYVISSIAADCKNDQLFMLTSSSYDTKGNVISKDDAGVILKNPNDKNSPATNLLMLICDLSAILNEKIRKNNDPMHNI